MTTLPAHLREAAEAEATKEPNLDWKEFVHGAEWLYSHFCETAERGFDEKLVEANWAGIRREYEVSQEDFITPGYNAYDAIVALVKWQHTQSAALLAAKDAEIAELAPLAENWTEALKWKPYLHFCFTAWDGLLIDRCDDEFEFCTCFNPKPTLLRDHRQQQLAAAKAEAESLFNKNTDLADNLVGAREENLRLRSALEDWIKWEREQIRKEGPYIGKAINSLILAGEEALQPTKGEG